MTIATRALRVVGFCALSAFLACALTPLPNAAARWLAEPASVVPAGAIVVLGADVRPDGALGDSSLRRAVVGIQQYGGGAAPVIVFLGSSRIVTVSEAAARRELASRLGLPETAILTDDRSLTTRDEARRVKALLEPRGITTILLVSDSLHLKRARTVFESEGFLVGTVPADSISLDVSAPEDRLRLTRSVLQQTAALLLYRLRG